MCVQALLLIRRAFLLETIDNERVLFLSKKLEEALQIASEAHLGQEDKGGHPYIHHVITVSENARKIVRSWEVFDIDFLYHAGIVGYLHDVLEDTDITIEDLRKCSFPDECILALEIITKQNDDYNEYLQRIKYNKLASVVKISDMEHNSDLSRINYVTLKDKERSEKYRKAIEYLSEFKCEKCNMIFPLRKMGYKAMSLNHCYCEDCIHKSKSKR